MNQHIFKISLMLFLFSVSIYLFCSCLFRIRIVLRDESSVVTHGHANIFDQLYGEIYKDNEEMVLKFKSINAAMSKYGKGPLPLMDEFKDEREAWLPARFDRSLLYLIDAMRFDFAIPITEEGKEERKDGNDILKNSNFHNHLTALHNTNVQFSHYQSIFISDPPTTSQQRVASIISGSLPNFIEAAFNFAMIESIQDNFLKQAKTILGPKGIYFFGDSIWATLFPSILSNETTLTTDEKNEDDLYAFEQKNVHTDYSFHIYDLDTVDRNIIKRVSPFLNHYATSSMPPFMLICHFLGVDHCGHKHGPNSRFMSDKLDELNSFLDFTKSRLGKSALFCIFGDHGMTDNGDHGGSSLKEITSGLILFARTPLNILDSIEKILYSLPKNTASAEYLLLEFESLKTFFEKLASIRASTFIEHDFSGLSRFIPRSSIQRKISQVDFGVNICLLTGLPIPFSSLGMIVPEFYFTVDPSSIFSSVDRPSSEVQTLLKTFRIQNQLFLLRATRLNLLSLIRHHKVLNESHQYITDVILTDIMPKFENYESLLAIDEKDLHLNHEKIEEYIIAYMTLMSEIVIKCRSSWSNQNIPMMLFSIFLLFFLLTLTLVPKLRNVLAETCLAFETYVFNISVAFLLIFQGFSYFSNSFIIYEYDIIRYLLSSCFLFLLYYRMYGPTKMPLYDIYTMVRLLFILKLSYYFGACREEQDNCFYISRDLAQNFSSQYPILIISVSFICFLMSVSLCRKLFIMSRFHFISFSVSLFLIFIRWTILLIAESALLDDQSPIMFLFSLLIMHIPKIIYGSLLVTVFVLKDIQPVYFFPIVLVLLRPLFGSFMALLILSLADAFRVLNHLQIPGPFKSSALFFSSLFVFFASGHQFCFATIQWEVAFYGFSDPSHYISALFIVINTFGPSILVYYLCRDANDFELKIFDFFLFSSFMLMMSCFLFRQNLMLWAVFSPKLIFILLFTFIFGLLSLFEGVSFLGKSAKQNREIDY